MLSAEEEAPAFDAACFAKRCLGRLASVHSLGLEES